MPPPPLRRSLALPLIIGALVTLGLTLGSFYWLMLPALEELGLMALFLTLTALASIAAGYAAYRAGLIHQSPRLRWAMWGSSILASLLTVLNVGVAAWRMFASPHDLLLATLLLVFASGIALALGYFFAEALAQRMSVLQDAAHRLAEGRLDTRAPVTGRDELADLARAFNRMAEQLETSARQQRELETLRRDLVAWASHDMQTPLAAVRAMLEALADGMVDDPATVQRYLRTAQRDIQALSHLMDDVFQVAQWDAGGPPLDCQPGSLADVISDALESFSALAAQKGVRLHGEAAPDLDPVWMDAPRIARVLSNLLNNAVRHTPAGGAVSVRAEREGQVVRVAVRDTGEGLSAKELPLVFERFYRGDQARNRETGGAGLGLAIAKGIVEAHGGRITAESQAGQGACFTFTLPAPARD
jgi:signal transduction histidine kinase